jgi:hypothetical protein
MKQTVVYFLLIVGIDCLFRKLVLIVFPSTYWKMLRCYLKLGHNHLLEARSNSLFIDHPAFQHYKL